MKERLIFGISIILLIAILIYIKTNYIYNENEYVLDGYFYTKNNKELLTGTVKYKKYHPYSTDEFTVKNGLVDGNYKAYADLHNEEEMENNNYISNTQFLEKVRKIIDKDKISVYYFSNYENLCYIINVYIKSIESRNYELKKIDDYLKYAQEILDLINVKHSQTSIVFIFGDNLVYMYRDYGYVFSYENRKLEYYLINKNYYRIVGDSTVFVPR